MTKFPFAFQGQRLRVALLTVAVLVAGVVGIGVRARLKSQAPKTVSPPGVAPLIHQASNTTKPTAHLLVLRPSGFEPAEVSWPKDRFFVAIDNHTSVSDLEVGGRVKEVNLKMRKQRAAGVFDLQPGTYLLTEASHPGWVCRITITPH
jgi:hypothetical protein